MDEIEQVRGGIKVMTPDKGFKRVDTPPGFTDLVFRNAVASVYTFWMAQGRLPSAEDVHSAWPKIPLLTYSALFQTEAFRQALEYRGVSWIEGAGLSLEQQMALTILSNPMDSRLLKVKLAELGVPQPRYQAWLKQPLFKAALEQRTRALYADFLPEVRNTLVSKAIAGDNKSIETVLAVSGEWNPQERAIQDARTVVLKVMEAVIRNVPDPEQRRAIMADIQGSVVAFDVSNNSLEV